MACNVGSQMLKQSKGGKRRDKQTKESAGLAQRQMCQGLCRQKFLGGELDRKPNAVLTSLRKALKLGQQLVEGRNNNTTRVEKTRLAPDVCSYHLRVSCAHFFL